MNWCCSRYTTGITIGACYILASVIYFVKELIFYIAECEDHVTSPERKKILQSESMESMIICCVSILISSLFIVAIVKRYQYLMIPWLLFAFYVFYVTLRTMYWGFIGAGMALASGMVFLILLIVLVGLIALEITIFWFSCSLFNEIRLENIEKFERIDKNLI